jgi:UPF0755 protein
MIVRQSFFILILFAALSAIGFGLYHGVSSAILNRPALTSQTSYYYLPKGSGLLRASYLGEQEGLVETHWHFAFAAKSLGLETKLKAGEYEISPGSKLREILSTITSGKTYKRRLTISEGRSNLQILAMLSGVFGLVQGDISEGKLLPEGSYLPETYFYERGESVEAVLSRMARGMDTEVQKAWDNRTANLPIQSIDEAITLASIVEKETGVGSERAVVAAVFINRLRRNMRLQSDPTVIYGITGGLPLERPISRADLRGDTPYNTYRINGLPPTPIANPGVAAIEAVLNPANVTYLYFVADGTGGHAFANTLSEHNKNVSRWRQIEREQRAQE